jgi:hypothetical protein
MNDGQTAEISAIVQAAEPAVVENQDLTLLKSQGLMSQPYLNLMIAIHYNNQSFTGTKDQLSSVELGDKYVNLYAPFKNFKNSTSHPFARDVIVSTIKGISEINNSKVLVLGKEKGASAPAALQKMFASVAENIRINFSSKTDDTVLFATGDTSVVLGDYLKVGTWAAQAKSEGLATVDHQGIVCISIQIPEMYDAENKFAEIAKVLKFLENFMSKEEPNTNVLLAVSMDAASLASKENRDFAEEMHDNFAYYPRAEVEAGEDEWMPKTKKDLESHVFPTTSQLLWVSAIGDTESTDE